MEATIFQYSDYKTYLARFSDSRPRGFRKTLAEAARCQTAYISSVFNGEAHLSWDQAEAIARAIGLTVEETHYLLLLIEHARGRTPSLKRHIQGQLTALREKNLTLKDRVAIQETLSPDHQAVYYSSWHYAAVHVAVSVPSLQTEQELRKSLRIAPRKLSSVVQFLVTAGLVRRQGERLTPGTTLVHLDKSSPAIHQHHANWRFKALESMHGDRDGESIHYSSVFSLSAQDAHKLREWIARNISEWIGVVKESKEEEVHGLTLDFFRVES